MNYLINRILSLIPTFFFIFVLNFILMNLLPGSPIDYLLMQNLNEEYAISNNQISNKKQLKIINDNNLNASIGKKFFCMLKSYMTFNFGTSIKYNQSVVSLILDRIINTFIIGLIASILLYILGIYSAVLYSTTSSNIIKSIINFINIMGYVIPNLIFAILMILFFSSGNYFFAIFPSQNLHSINWHEMNFIEKIQDYILHITLPILTIVIGNINYYFKYIKDRINHEKNKNYYQMALNKGLTKKQAIYSHLTKNASMTLIAAFPSHLDYIIFSGKLFFIEIAFSINGIGLLGYDAIISRDYPLMMGVIFMQGVGILFGKLVNDILYMILDKRIVHN